MANKQRSRVGYQPLRLRSSLSEGLASIPSFGDPSAQAQASTFSAIAADFSTMADQMASEEGERAGLTASTDLSWRPTRASTIRGRAYDRAGMRVYQDRLESQMRTDLQGLADENEGNPRGFADAALNLRQTYQTEVLFDEVREPSRIMFNDLARRHGRVLLEQQRAARRDTEMLAARSRLIDLENVASRQMEAVRSGSGGARDLLLGTEAQVQRHYAAMVADGLMSPDAAERAVGERQRSVAVDYYLSQAQQAMQAGDLDGMRETLSADYQSGGLDDLDAAGWEQLQTRLSALERERDTQAVFAADVLDRQTSAVSQRVALGFGNPAEIAELQREAASHADAEAAQTRVMDDLALANRLHSMPVPDARAELARLRDAAQNDRALALVHRGETMLGAITREANDNPLGLAERRHLIGEVQSLFDAESPHEREALIATRISQRDAAALGLGVPSVFFRDDEVDQIRMLVRDDPMQAASLAGDLVSALSDDAPMVLRELSGQAEPMMEAGMVLAAGGSHQAARDVLVGYARDANSSRLPSVPSDRRVDVISTHVDAALIDQPDDSRRIQDTAHAIARARVAEMGIDPDSDEALPVMRDALDAAAGGHVIEGQRYGGFGVYNPSGWAGPSRVWVPPTVRADLFPDVLRAIRNADLAALPVPPVDARGEPLRASELHGAVPIAVAGGYRFATGNPRSADPAYIADAQGNAFVLPFDQMVPELRTRLPEAFR